MIWPSAVSRTGFSKVSSDQAVKGTNRLIVIAYVPPKSFQIMRVPFKMIDPLRAVLRS
jgi:hypothetical protein